MTYSLLSIVHKIMAAVQPEGMVKQILDQVIVGNKLTPPSGPLKLDIGGITYQVSATKNMGYFSARFMTEQTDAARRELPSRDSRDIETEKKRAIALAENILNIHWHASIGNKRVLNELPLKYINPDITGANGATPLICAVNSGYAAVVELFLLQGANVNALDNDGYSPLRNAAALGHTEILKLLLQSGADVNVSDNVGRSPLTKAAANGHTRIVELLLQKGANVNVSDYLGRSPLMRAVSNGYTKIVELLLQQGANVDIIDIYGHTPLTKAVTNGHTEIVRSLLRNGAGVDTRNETGCTELILTASIVHTGIETAKIAKIAELLLRSGADVDAADNHGHTPLTTAAANGHSKIVELLLDYGADPNQSENTKSPLTFTIRELIKSNEDNRAGLIEAMRLLLANGADITGKWEDEANPGAGLTIKDKIVRLSKDYDINNVLEALNRPGSAQASRFPHRLTLKMQAARTVINAVKANKQNKPLPEALKALPLSDSIREMLLNK